MADSTAIETLDRMQNVIQRFSSADNGASYSLLPGHKYEISVDTTGSAGSATGNTSLSNMHGTLAEIIVTYHASAPDTTVVTITETEGSANIPVLTVSAGNTTVKKVPLVQAVDSADSGISGGYVYHILSSSTLKIAVSASDALTDAVVVYVKTM